MPRGPKLSTVSVTKPQDAIRLPKRSSSRSQFPLQLCSNTTAGQGPALLVSLKSPWRGCRLTSTRSISPTIADDLDSTHHAASPSTDTVAHAAALASVLKGRHFDSR